jgi:hypothetical protein
VANRHPGHAGERRAQRGRVEGGGDAFAPRRRPQPREVDDVRVLGQLRRAREGTRHLRLVMGVHQHDLRQPAQRVERLGVPVRRPDHRGQVRDQQRIDDRVEVGQVLRPDLDLDALARDAEMAGRRIVVVGADAGPGVDRRPPRRDRAEDEPGRVVAADALEPVLDLAAELRLDHDDHVEHARRHQRIVAPVVLDHDVAQRRLDPRRRRVALRPDLVH